MRRLPLLLVLLLLPGVGCRQSGSKDGSAKISSVKSFPVKGKVISTDATHVMLDHEAVPGFMDAMTMSYKVKDPSVLSELHAGDKIAATILVEEDAAGYKTPQLTDIIVIAQAKPDYVPKVQYHVPAAGDTVPAFRMLNQNGRMINLSEFKGKVLVATFIYTRCQMAAFCPRMSTNFAEIDKALAAEPAVYSKTHLLSISFDPAYDTPSVLKKYGASYTGRFAKETFAHWDFAAPPESELAAITQYFDVGVQPGDPKTMTHSLSTVVIGKDGRVVAWYPNNEWKPADVVAEVRKAVEEKSQMVHTMPTGGSSSVAENSLMFAR